MASLMLVKTDVTNQDSVQAMVKKTLGEFGQIDVLANVVGWTFDRSVYGEAAGGNGKGDQSEPLECYKLRQGSGSHMIAAKEWQDC